MLRALLFELPAFLAMATFLVAAAAYLGGPL